MTILRTNKPELPTGKDYLHAALCLILLAALCFGVREIGKALNYQPSAEHQTIMHGARMLTEGMGR